MQQAYLRRSARTLPGSGEDELLLEVRLLLGSVAPRGADAAQRHRLAPSYDCSLCGRCLRLMARLPEALKANERTEASGKAKISGSPFAASEVKF